MELEMARGVRDFPPEEKIVRQEVVRNLTEVFERYGFSPLETPAIERWEILAAKFAAGEGSDTLKETFRLEDQGGRKLGLRFDLTVPLARFLAMNPNLKMPFRRYEIGRTYRDGPIKLGRYREFWQCDVDIIGCKGMLAEVELMRLSLDAMKAMQLDAYLEINNRKLLDGIMDYSDVAIDKRQQSIIIIDKLKKIGAEEVKKELTLAGVSEKAIGKLLEVFSAKDVSDSSDNALNRLKAIIQSESGVEGIKELEELFSYLTDEEKKSIKLNIALARGLSYYTGTVFEGFLKDSEMTSSICGGGRYDKLIGLYLEGEKEFPAVGISFGLEPITESIKLKNPNMAKTVAQVYIAPIKAVKESMAIAKTMRDAGIRVDIDILGRGVSKNLDYADKMGIPFTIVIGETELKEGKVKVKDMKSGEEKEMAISELPNLKF